MAKKLLGMALAAAAGGALLAKVRSTQAEQDLWSEATDPVEPAN